jgi:transposase
LSGLDEAAKEALILAQAKLIAGQGEQIQALTTRHAEQIEVLTRRIAELEAKLGAPPKTPDNSSVPPSKGQKPNRAERRAAARRKGRPGVARKLAEHPDEVVEALAAACPHCGEALSEADQEDVHAYDHVDIPPIRPIVTRVRLHRGRCRCCRRRFTAPAPEQMAPGSPFGPNIVALIVHLHVTQMIGFERLAKLMAELFGLSISEGAIANILARAEPKLASAAREIAGEVRASPVVASDETSARVQGRTWWQWVMSSSAGVHHMIADTRSAGVVTDFLDGAVPEVWVADRYAGQNNHGLQRQVCLAHLLRDAQYAIDAGDAGFAPAFQKLLRRACAVAARRPDLKDSTLAQYRSTFESRLDRLLAAESTSEAGRKLAKAVKRCRSDLFVFMSRRDAACTNNVSERALRPSVIFRKVTGGFRSQWGARAYAAAVSVIATGQLRGQTALAALRQALATPAPA